MKCLNGWLITEIPKQINIGSQILITWLRGVAGGFDGWFDEIHLKSHKFKVVTNAYKHLIFECRVKEEMFFEKEKKAVGGRWSFDEDYYNLVSGYVYKL